MVTWIGLNRWEAQFLISRTITEITVVLSTLTVPYVILCNLISGFSRNSFAATAGIVRAQLISAMSPKKILLCFHSAQLSINKRVQSVEPVWSWTGSTNSEICISNEAADAKAMLEFGGYETHARILSNRETEERSVCAEAFPSFRVEICPFKYAEMWSQAIPCVFRKYINMSHFLLLYE